MSTSPNKIILNLDSDGEVSVKAFIAPIEYTQYNFHVEWEALANLRVAEQERLHPTTVFRSFLPKESVLVGECWQIEETGVIELLRQLNPNPINPNPNLDMHMNAEDSLGLWACLRAYFDSETKLPSTGVPKEALISAWGIEPGSKDTIRHRFEKGKIFKLGATGDWFSKKGDVNAFRAKIFVEED